MLFRIAFAAIILRTFAIAQGTGDLPACAQDCLLGSSKPATTCAATDIGCLCRDADYVNKQGCCIENKCPQADVAAARKLAGSLCAAASVTVADTKPTGCSAGGSSGSASATKSSSPSSVTSAAASSALAETGAAFKMARGGWEYPLAVVGGLAVLGF